MKIFIGLLLGFLTLNAAFGVPVDNPKNDVDVIAPKRSNPRGLVYEPFTPPFLQSEPQSPTLLSVLRAFFSDVFPQDTGNTSSDSSESAEDSHPSQDGFPFLVRTIIPAIPEIPKNVQKTSTIKVVNGNRVEVNETTFGDSESLFKKRVFSVRPLEEGEVVDEVVITDNGSGPVVRPLNEPDTAVRPVTTAPKKNNEKDNDNDSDERREPIEKETGDNEISNVDIDGPQQIATTTATTNKISVVTDKNSATETVDDSIAAETTIDAMESLATDSQAHEQMQDESISAHNEAENEKLISESIPTHEHQRQRENIESSSSDDDTDDNNDGDDIDGNDDFTVIEMHPTFDTEWSTLVEDLAQGNDAQNNLNNDIDAYDTLPIDLSNDIAVNDAAAANPNYPLNPDAEFIDVDQINADTDDHSNIATIPKFEKLLVMPQV